METLKIMNPATGEILKEISCHTEQEIKLILENGQTGFKKWAKVNAHERSRLLKDWARKIQEHKAELAEIITKENGKLLVKLLVKLIMQLAILIGMRKKLYVFTDEQSQHLLKQNES